MEEGNKSVEMDVTICSEFDRLLDEYEDKHGGVYFDVDRAYVEYYHQAMVYSILPNILDGMNPEKAVKDWLKNKAKEDFEEILELMEI